MTNFQKLTFDNSFIAMEKMQEQGDAMLNGFLNQADWMPEEGRNVIKEWSKGCRSARDEFRKIVDEGFKTVENYADTFAGNQKSAAKAKK